jgi:hypothetical protein
MVVSLVLSHIEDDARFSIAGLVSRTVQLVDFVSATGTHGLYRSGENRTGSPSPLSGVKNEPRQMI